MALRKKKKPRRRSHYEDMVEDDLIQRAGKRNVSYESVRLEYTIVHTYVLDFSVRRSRKGLLLIETKGRFTSPDRRKMLAVKEQHPDLDIHLLFYRASEKLYKGSKTTYAMWAEKHGFKWAQGKVPKEWL